MNRTTAEMGSNMEPRVLIADDDVNLRNNLRKQFRQEGFRVTCTGSIDGSVRGLSNKHFDVIIMDMRMPFKKNQRHVEQDAGLTVTRLMRNLSLVGQDVLVVVFTAFPSVKDCFAAVRAGAYYLPKVLRGKNMSEELVEECSHFVSERRGPQREKEPTWLTQHYEELIKKFGGKTVAVVDRETWEKCGLRGGKRVGECMVFPAQSLEEIQNKITKNPRFYRAMPVILDLFEEEYEK